MLPDRNDQPLTNVSLYIGAFVLLNIAISPLELTTLGLLSRIITSINKSKPTLITARHILLIGLVITVGLILSLIGGAYAGNDYSKTNVYTPQTTSKVGIGLWIASFAAIVVATVVGSFSVSHADLGEKRVLFAVADPLPLMLVRLVYSAISIFAYTPRFNSVDGDVTILLCMALLEELAIVIMYESVGITLKKLERHDTPNSKECGAEHNSA